MTLRRCGIAVLLVMLSAAPALAQFRSFSPLDVAVVTTGSTPVTAISPTHRTAGGYLYNPPAPNTVNLCINEIDAAGITSSGNTTCIIPGQGYNLTQSGLGVSVNATDSAHVFSGYGLRQ